MVDIWVEFRYNSEMSKTVKNNRNFSEAQHLQAMESNPLDAQDKAMFEMFERKGWSPEKRRTYILEQAKAGSLVPATE